MAAIYTISRDGYVCVSVRLGYYWRFYGAVEVLKSELVLAGHMNSGS
jgi:hypothetical protein